MLAKAALVAGGVGAAVWAASRAGGEKRPKRTQERKQVKRRHRQQHEHEDAGRLEAEGGRSKSSLPAAPAVAAVRSSGSGTVAYLLLLLQALLSAAAVLYAEQLRPRPFGGRLSGLDSLSSQDWQQLLALVAASAMVLSVAGWQRWRQQEQEKLLQARLQQVKQQQHLNHHHSHHRLRHQRARQHRHGAPRAAPGEAGRSSGGGSGTAAYLLLLLQALLSAAAVLYAEQLRPRPFGGRLSGLDSLSSQDWQQLLALVAASAMVLSVAGWQRWRQQQQEAAVAAGAAAAAAAVAEAAEQQQGQVAVPPQDLYGTWIKNKAQSDSMEPVLNAMKLGGLVRTAIRLVKGLQIAQQGGVFRMSVLSGILWFKITESYPVDGTPQQYRRRDLRRGLHTGHVERCPRTGGILLKLQWGEPLGGHGCDHFHLASPDVLHVDTSLTVGGTTLHYRQVYRRKQ